MYQSNRIVLVLIMVILLMILLPAFAGTGFVGLMEEGEYPDDDDASAMAHFPVDWIGLQSHQLSVSLGLAVSIFALFVVYLGGRSKNKRFNNRTFEVIKSSIVIFFKTTLFRVVFCFGLFGHCLDQTNHQLTNVFSSRNPYLGGINP